MKYIATIVLIMYTFHCSSQSKKAQDVIGSFVYNQELFNYNYKSTPNTISSLRIERVADEGGFNYTLLNQEIPLLATLISDQAGLWGFPKDTVSSISEMLKKTQDAFTTSLKNLESGQRYIDRLYNRLIAIQDSSIAKKLKSDGDLANMKVLLTKLSVVSKAAKVVQKNKREIPIGDFTPEAVKEVLRMQLFSFFGKDVDPGDLNDISLKIFYQVTTRISFDDDQPETAELRLHASRIKGYIRKVNIENIKTNLKQAEVRVGQITLKKRKNHTYVDVPFDMTFNDAEFEFEAGTIKNISARFTIIQGDSVKSITFRNNIPISIANKFSREALAHQRIYASVPALLDQRSAIDQFLPVDIRPDTTKNFVTNSYDVYFKLGDLVEYDYKLESNTEDYSPEDITVVLSETQRVVRLKKQQRSRILAVRAFTDFNGINVEEPNGLLQFEGTLGVNVNTYRSQRLLFWFFERLYQGFFTKAELTGYLSKLEQEKRFFNLTQMDTLPVPSDGRKQFQVRPLDNFQHRSSGIDLKLNLWRLNLPKYMLNIQLNGAYGIFRTAFVDSLAISGDRWLKTTNRSERTETSIYKQLSATLEFMPEGRYGMRTTYSRVWPSIESSSISKAATAGREINVFSFEGFLHLNPDKTSKLFFRWRLNTEGGNRKYNYNEAQLGYLVDVFKVNR